MSLDRALRRWIGRQASKQSDAATTQSTKVVLSTKVISRGRSRGRTAADRLQIERLESRILLSADPLSFVAPANMAQDLTLTLIDKAGIPTIQIVDTATSTVTMQKSVADTSRVSITLSNRADTIRVANDFSSIVAVSVDGQAGSNTLVGKSSGATFTVTGADSGMVDGVSFTHISHLQGANGASDVFVFKPGGSESNGVDGGTGAVNTVIGQSTGATFTETGANQGSLHENASSNTTAFSNIGRLQGGDGADMFVINANASLSGGLDGGGGVNSVHSSVGGTAYTITGADAGTVGNISFTHVGKVQGVGGAPDRYVISSGASLSSGIDGGTSANNTLTGPSTGATYNITGQDSGNVGGVSFVNVGRLQGANGAADTFTFAAGGSLTGGFDGGSGGQNTVLGPSTGATFTLNGVNAGTVQETGASRITSFANIDRVQGGAGTDALVLGNAGALTRGFDGGAGVNTVQGSAAGATFNITGADAGNVGGVTFTHVGKLQGGAGADAFLLVAGASLSSGLDGGAGANSVSGAGGSTFTISGRDRGSIGSTVFANIGRLLGAANAPDNFVLAPGGSLSSGLDGGLGGQNVLTGAATGATFTLSGADAGSEQENGSSFTTTFSNIGKLQGGGGADTLIIKAGTSLSNGFDGGSGVNTVRGPTAGATYNITGADAGTVSGVAFIHVGKLVGADNAPDTFVFSPSGSLSGGLDGGTGGRNLLTGPSTGALFTITGRDAGTINGTAFVNVGQLRGADNAPDSFTLAGGSLSGGIDGGAGGQNKLVGPGTGATFTITGRDAGNVAGTTFVNIGQLQGADNAADTFALRPGGSLSTGLDGGAGGGNILIGPSTGATFDVVRLDGGSIQEKGAAFVTLFNNVGTLQGADNTSDLFIVEAAGSLTGSVMGGTGANDTLRLLGSVVTATYIAAGPQSGRYELDNRSVAFSGIETLDDELTSQNRVVRGTDGTDFLTISQNGATVTVSAPTIDKVSFTQPSGSLTVDGGGGIDVINVASNLKLPNVALTLDSEIITVSGESVDTSGGTNGNITLDSEGTPIAGNAPVNGVANGSIAASFAIITLTGTTLFAGGTINVTANANYTGIVSGNAVAALGVGEAAWITLSTSALTAVGVINIAASTHADVTVAATGTGNQAGNDAAVATTYLDISSRLRISNSSITAGGSIAAQSVTTVHARTTADASGASAGGAAANTVGTVRSTVDLEGTNTIVAGAVMTGGGGNGVMTGGGGNGVMTGGGGNGVMTGGGGNGVMTGGGGNGGMGATNGQYLTLASSSTADIGTVARASVGGVSGSTPRTTSLLADANAATTEGPVRAAAAVATNALTGDDNVNIGGNATMTAGAGVILFSTDTHTISATADSSSTSTSNGLAAAVAINSVTQNSLATVSGALDVTSAQLTIAAAENSTVNATAVSGLGSQGATGLAGALTINDVSVKPTASITPPNSTSSAQVTLHGAKLVMMSNITGSATARSGGAVNGGGAAVGVGPSIALNFSDNDLSIAIDGGVTGATQISLTGGGQDTLLTQATAGSAGGVAVTPVLALSSSENDSSIKVNAGPALTTPGALTIDLDRTQQTTTIADASTQATKAGIGAALALSFGFQNATARIDRTVTAGSVALSNRFRSDEITDAIASARGVDSGSRRGNASGQLNNEISFTNNRTGQAAAQPDTQTSSGQFGLAAALAIDIHSGGIRSAIGPGVTVTSTSGAASVESLSDFDATTTADASLVKPAGNVGIGAALAINSLSPQTYAEIDGTVSAQQGVTIHAGQATDASSPGVDTIVAKAIAGAGGNTFGAAGTFALNLLNFDNRALVAGSASVSAGALPLNIAAAAADDVTTIATADGSSGGSGSGVGLGAAVALTVSKNTVLARIDGTATVTGAGGLNVSASGADAVHGDAEAGGTGGSVGVAPSTFIVVSSNTTQAEIAAPVNNKPGLSLGGAVSLSAVHSLSIDGKAGSAGSGATAGIGLSFALAVIEDTAKALFSRSVTTSGDISGRASNAIDVALTSRASSAGGAANGQGNANGQIGKELSFANQRKGGTAAAAPQAETSAGTFGLAGALALSIVNSQSVAQQAAAATLVSNAGSVLLEALGDTDSSATADASLVRPASNVGIGAAVAINAASPQMLAEFDGTVSAAHGSVTVRTGAAADASSQGVDTFVAKAIAGAGGNTFGGAGALGLNVLGANSRAIIAGTANVTAGAQVGLSATQATDATTIATADAAAGAGGSGVGVGLGVAITLDSNSETARLEGAAQVVAGSLSLTATGNHAVHGQAKAGDTGGSVGVAPSTFLVVSQNNTLAELAAPPLNGSGLSVGGSVALSASHTATIDGSAGAAGSGSSAGIGLSLTLAVVEDTAKALISRSVTVTGPTGDVTDRASNLVDVTLTSQASAAGGAADGQSNSDGQINKELGFANRKKGGTAATAQSADVPNANGDATKVGIAAAISLSIVNSQSAAALATGRSITTPGAVTIEAIGDADSRIKADASSVDPTQPQVGVGVAVALNIANLATTATVGGTVNSAGLSIHALAPTSPGESHSDLSATAISGAGARDVGVAGALAANFVNMKSNALLGVSAVETSGGDVDIRSQLLTRPEAVASSSVTAANGGDGSGGAVGVGLSVALNVLTSQSTASIPNNVTLTGGRNVTIEAQGENLTKTWAVSGISQGNVGIAPALALLVAEDKTTATLGTGVPLNLAGSFTLSVQQKVTGDTKSDAGVKGSTGVGVGAAVALDIIEDTADASPSRNLTTHGDITVSADLVADVQANAVASAAGVNRSSGPTTTDGQVASTTKFANTESGASTTAPQVAKTNGGSGAEQSVGVAAALALNVINTHARASLSSISVNSGGGVAVLSAMDVDGGAMADGSTAQQSIGVGAAVALNVITADNTALLNTPVTAAGAVTVEASMSANGDGIDTFVARANSGAASTQVGVAGAVALELLNLPTKAQILAPVNAGGGYVTVSAENRSTSSAIASSHATARGQANGGGNGIGVGASFALSVLGLPVLAQVADGVTLSGAGGLTVSASGDHVAVTTAEAGSAGNISISPAVAITVAASDTTASLGAGAAFVAGGSGGVRIEAIHHGDYQSTADGQAGGSNVAVGAAIALDVVLEQATAATYRDISATGDVRIRATNAMAGSASATGAAKGNSSNSSNADGEAQSALNNNSNIAKNKTVAALPGGQIALPKSADQANQGSSTVAAQADGRGGAKVGVGAAIGINFVSTAARAQLLSPSSQTQPGRTIVSRQGQVEVSSALQVDGTAEGIGSAIVDQLKNTSVGAGVALNVINATNLASVGDNAVVSAANGVKIAALMAPINGNATNDLVVQSAAAAGAQKYGIAGAVSIDVVTYDTRSEIGQNGNINGGAGAVDVDAQADFTVQNLAGAGGFGDSAGVGAAILVQISTIGTTAIVHQNSQVDGVAGVHVVAEASYVPRADNFKGFGFALTSGAFGGSGSDGGTAIGGSVAVNVVNLNTEAHFDGGVRVNQRNAATGSVVLDAASTVVLFGGAGGVGAATGNLGIGAGIDVTILNQKTLALLADGVVVSTAGDVSVQAHSSNQETAIAGSFGLGSNAGAGSIVVDLYNTSSDPLYGTRAVVGNNAVVLSGGQVSVVASNPRDNAGNLITDSLRVVAGSVSGASSLAVGIASAIVIRSDTFIASVGNNAQVRQARGLQVGATGGLDATMVAAAGVGGLEDGAAGSVTVSTLNETASATIGQSATVTGTSAAGDVKVTADDRTQLVKVAGAASFGGDLGVGAGLDVGVLTKNTTASIGAHALVSTLGSVEVRAFSKEKINAFAASAGASSELAIAGSVSVQVDTINTRAFIEGTTTQNAPTVVTAAGNVVVEASAENEMDLFAGGLGFSGTTAIGASAPIPVINKLTEAFIGQNAIVTAYGFAAPASVRSGGFTVSYVDAPSNGPREATTPLTGSFSFSLNGSVAQTGDAGNPQVGDPNANQERVVTAGTVNVRGVAVSATNYDDIGVVAISGGASGSVAVNVTGAVTASNITTSGRIDAGASINNQPGASADQNVLVVGSDNYRSLIVSIGASVSGTAAIAPAVAVDVVTLTTQALIAGTVTVNASNSVGVKASTSEDLQSVVASVGIAGTAGISGSPAIVVLNDHTTARIGDSASVHPDVAAIVHAGGSVVVQAIDDTDILDVDGSIGIGGTAGAGVGVDINSVTKDTTARVAAGSVVDAGAASGASGVSGLGGVDGRFGNNTTSWSGLLVLAGSSEDIGSVAIAGSAAGTIGGAGAVNLNLIQSNTAASIGNFARINQNINGSPGQDIRVDANNAVSAVAVTGGLGAGGSGGLAGAVGIGIVHNGTTATIGNNVTATAQGTVSVEAISHQDITAVDVSGALAGAFAAAISTGIWVIGDAFNAGGGAASESSWANDYQATLSGAALGGFSGMLSGNQPIAFANGDVRGNSVDLHTSTLRTGDPVIYHSNGSASGNLVDGKTYYLIKTGSTYALAASLSDADAGRAIALGNLRGGSIEQADNSRAQGGLQQARAGIVAAQPTTRLSDSLGLGTAPLGTTAQVMTGSAIKAYGGMDVTAHDDLDFVQVAGEVAASGAASIGGGFATLVHTDTVRALVGDNVTITANGTGLDVEALSSEGVVQVAAGGGAAGAASILGSATVTLLNETTLAGLGKNVSVSGTATVAGTYPDVKVIAHDDTTVTDVAGAIGFGGVAAVGVGADAVLLTKTTLATIDQNDHITTAGSVELRAITNEDVTSVAAVGSAAGAAAINLSASVVVANITTQALVISSPTTVISADGNVVVEAASASEYDLWGISAQLAGAAAIGASAAVPVVTKHVIADIGDNTTVTGRGLAGPASVRNGTFGEAISSSPTDVTSNAAGDGNLGLGTPSYANGSNSDLSQSGNQRQNYDANQNYAGDTQAGQRKSVAVTQSGFYGVAVTATNSDDIASTGLSIGAAGAAAVSLTGSVQSVSATSQARIGKNAKIDTLATFPIQSVLVGAGNDFRSLVLAAGASIAGAAAVTPSVAVEVASLTTTALIDSGATVKAGGGISVQALAHEELTTVAAAAAGAVFAGVAFAPNVTALDSHTTASIGGSATVTAGGTVAVLARDDTRSIEVAATLGVGIAGVGIGGNVLLLTKSTQALVGDGAVVTADGYGNAVYGVVSDLGSADQDYAIQTRGGAVNGVVVQAISSENITAITGSAGAGIAGVGMAADIVVVDSDTLAEIGNNAAVTSSNGSVTVTAANTLQSFTFAGALGAGIVGVGGGVTVGIVRNGVQASIGDNTTVTANGGNVEVIALSRKDIDSFDIAGGFGLGALAGSVGIWTFGGAVSSNYGYNDVDGQGNSGAAESSDALGGASGWNNNYDNAANGSTAPGGNFGSILNGQTGSGGNASRIAAAQQSAEPTVSATHPATSITAQLNNTGNIEGTTARVGFGDRVSAVGSVIVRAKDATTVSQTAGNFSGGAISVGGSIALVTLNMPVTAMIESNATISAGRLLVSNGDIDVEAAQVTSVKGFVFAGSGGLITLGAQVLIVTDNTSEYAWVERGTQLSGVGNISINATAFQTYSGGAFGATANAIGAGASISIVNVNGGVHARQDGNVTGLFGSMSVTAMADISVTLQTFGVGLGIIGGINGAVASSHIGKGTEAYISDTSTTSVFGDVTVAAVELAGANLATYAVQLAGLVGIGIAASVADIDPTIAANAGGGFNLGGTLSIVTEFNTDAQGTRVDGRGAQTQAFSVGAAIGLGAAGAVAISTVSPLVLATIDNGARLAGIFGSAPNLVVRSLSGSQANATARGIGIGVIGGVGASVAKAKVTDINQAHALGANLVLGSSGASIGSVTVDARSVDDASAQSFAAAGGILAGGFAVNLADANVGGAVSAQLGSGAQVFVRDLTVNAGEFGSTNAESDGVAIGGVGVAGAASVANSTHSIGVHAIIDGSTVNVLNSVQILATTGRASANAKAVATGAALLAGVTVNSATADSTGSTEAVLRNGDIYGPDSASVKIHAEGNSDATSDASGTSAGILGVGSTHATTLNNHSTNALVDTGAQIGQQADDDSDFGGSDNHVGSIEISTVSSGTGTVEASGAAGGIGTKVDVLAKIDVTPVAQATVGALAGLYGNSVLVSASNYAEGDGTLKGKTVSLADFSSMELDHNVVQTAKAIISGGATIDSLGDFTLTATGGQLVIPGGYDGTSTVTGGGFTVGIIGHSHGEATANVTSNVKAAILEGSTQNPTLIDVAGDLNITATGTAKANAVSSDTDIGGLNFISTTANAFVNAETDAFIGDPAFVGGSDSLQLYIGGQATVNAGATLVNYASSKDSGGGLASFGASDAQARTYYRTTAAFGTELDFHASALDMTATTSHTENTYIKNTAGGAAAASIAGDNGSGSFVSDGSSSSVFIGRAANLTVAGAIHFTAKIINSSLLAYGESNADDAVGDSEAYATAIAQDKVLITLSQYSNITAYDGLYVTGNVSNYKLQTDAEVYATTDANAEDSYSQNEADVTIAIDAQPGSIVAVGRDVIQPFDDSDAALTVTTSLNVIRAARAENDGAGVNGTDHVNGRDKTDLPNDRDDNSGDRSNATISWNSDTTLLKVNAPKFIDIGSDGVVQDANGISIDGYAAYIAYALENSLPILPLVGYQTVGTINVDDITATEVNHAVFQATTNNITLNPDLRTTYITDDGVIDSRGNATDRNIITGNQGTWSIGLGADIIRIDNQSSNALVLNNIDTVATNTSTYYPDISIEVADAKGFKFDIKPFYGTPTVLVDNEYSDVTINGLINNPVGNTFIDSGAGRIVQGGQNGLIRTWELTTYGASLGTYEPGNIGPKIARIHPLNEIDSDVYLPVYIELVQSPGRIPHAYLYSDNVYIDLTTRLRDASQTSAEAIIDLSDTTPYIIAHAAEWDSYWQPYLDAFSAPPAGITIGATGSTTNQAAGISIQKFYRSYYYPDSNQLSVDVTSAYGSNYGVLTGVTYYLPPGTNSGFISSDPMVTTTFANVNSSRSLMVSDSPSAAAFSAAASNPIIVAAGSAKTDSVMLAQPASSLAVESPMHTVVESALMNYFGVSEDDLAAIAAGVQANDPSDVLLQNYADLEPALTRIDRVTKPQILWR